VTAGNLVSCCLSDIYVVFDYSLKFRYLQSNPTGTTAFDAVNDIIADAPTMAESTTMLVGHRLRENPASGHVEDLGPSKFIITDAKISR